MTMSPAGQRTRWEITGLPDWPNPVSVYLSVDTAAPVVTEAIERAAVANGITLALIERVGLEEEED